MDIFDRSHLQDLLKAQDPPCVSIFLPTHRAGREVQQDPIRLKNLLRQAQRRVEELGFRSSCDITRKANGLVTDSHFWRHQGDGLALFLSPSEHRHYRLPASFEELVVVADHFHLKPLLPVMSSAEHFYVLGLSQKYVKLFRGGRFSVGEVQLEGVPESLADALRFDDREASLQSHGGRTTAIFHGHGLGKDDPKDDIRRYFRQIDAGLHDILRSDGSPLVLAGVDYLLPIYREITAHPNVVAGGVVGSPERVSIKQLHAEAWKLVAPQFDEERSAAKSQYLSLADTPRGSADVKRVIRAAHQGRVDSLFVAVGEHLWGRWDRQTDAITIDEQSRAGDIDLLDAAAAQTWMHGGSVFVVAPGEVPGEGKLAAVLRY